MGDRARDEASVAAARAMNPAAPMGLVGGACPATTWRSTPMWAPGEETKGL